ncbi:MAG TPA: hypothetical protein VN841_12105 [Bryobacteraceae bacterium]|nr:hypothetical protein [Bryobacteraceae bacterium]
MKVVVRNPSLPVLVGWILLGLSIRKSTRLREWHAGMETAPVSDADLKAGFLERLRTARHLADTSTELGLRS